MAILFNSTTIGGTTGTGAFPSYSINREDNSTADGTYIGSKFTITITGIIGVGGSFSTRGEVQENLQNALKSKLGISGDYGRLEISPYGGQPNTITFTDAKLISVEAATIPENFEIEYTLIFEAHEDSSSSNNSGWALAKKDPTLKLSSSEESWDLQTNDGQFTFDGSNLDSGDMYKTYTLTHTVSAVGLRKLLDSSGRLNADNGHAWSQAAGWVYDRIKAAGGLDPDQAIDEDIFKNTSEISAKFHPFYMNKDGETNIADLKTDTYKARNKTRVINSDITNGSYSVTDSWIVSRSEVKALHEINISIDNSNDSAAVFVTVDGAVTGLTEKDINDNKDDKYANALTEYKKFFEGASTALASKIGAAAKTVYDAFEAAGIKTNSLQTKAISHQETHNTTDGIINWSTTFNDEAISIEGAISQNIQVQITNSNGQNRRYEIQSPSVIETIRNGPYIYNPNTTTEKKISVNIDLIMDFDHRGSRPNGFSIVDLDYLPYFQSFWHPPRITTNTESWNPKTGAYNLSVEYTYV